MYPSTTYAGGYASQDLQQLYLETQLQHERNLHAITKQMLCCEQEKARNLQAELEDSRSIAATLSLTNRLHVGALTAANMQGIQPGGDCLLKTKDQLNVTGNAGYSDVVQTVGSPDHLLGDTAGSSRTSVHAHEGSAQLSPSSVNDPRPSILYDVLTQHRAVYAGRIPDFHSSVQESAKQECFGGVVHHQTEDVKQEEEHVVGKQEDQGLDSGNEKVTELSNAIELESGGPASIDFCSLDAAFVSEFFSSEASLKREHSPQRELSGDTLIDVFPEEACSPKSDVLNGVSLEVGTCELQQHSTQEEDHHVIVLETDVVPEELGNVLQSTWGVEPVSCDADLCFEATLY